MCGRYYVDDETSREIEKIVRKLDQRLKIGLTDKQLSSIVVKEGILYSVGSISISLILMWICQQPAKHLRP